MPVFQAIFLDEEKSRQTKLSPGRSTSSIAETVSQLAGESRLSILSLIVFFVVGGLLLTRVDEQEGIRAAQEEDRAAGVA